MSFSILSPSHRARPEAPGSSLPGEEREDGSSYAGSASTTSDRQTPSLESPLSWLESEITTSPSPEMGRVSTRHVASKAQHAQAERALPALLAMAVTPLPRVESAPFFAPLPPCSLEHLLTTYQQALEVCAAQGKSQAGSSESHRPALLLKGSLATQSALGADLPALVQAGTDLDLQVMAGPWLQRPCEWGEWATLTRQAAALWIWALQRNLPPHALAHPLHRPELDQISRRFFSTRFAIDGSNAQGAWSLHRLDIGLPNGTRNHLDLTSVFRQGRPYLSDDAAWQVVLPVGGHEVHLTSWLPPKRALERVRQQVFDIPQPEEVERGVLEKILVKQARGMGYVGLQVPGEVQRLRDRFLASCTAEGGAAQVERVARTRLTAQMEGLTTGWEKILFQLQVGMMIPQLGWLTSWESLGDWPEGWQSIAEWIGQTSCEEAGLFLQGCGPYLNGVLQRQQLAPLPLWQPPDSQFLERWGALARGEGWRGLVQTLPVGPCVGRVDLQWVLRWCDHLEAAADPSQDAQLVLAWLGASAAEEESIRAPAHESIEQRAARCVLEIEQLDNLLALVAPFPALARCLQPLVQMRARSFSCMSRSQRHALLMDHLQGWSGLGGWLVSEQSHALEHPARLRAVWDALQMSAQRGDSLPQELVQEVGQSDSPLVRRPSDAALIFALAMELESEGSPAAHESAGQRMPNRLLSWMTAELRGAMPPALATREARAWIKLLLHPVEVRLSVLQLLWDLSLQGRWGLAGSSLRQALLDHLRDRRLPPQQADELWVMLESWSAVAADGWDLFPLEAVEHLSEDVALRRCSRAWQLGRWSAPESFLLGRLCSETQWNVAAARQAQREGWPLEEEGSWRLLVAELRDGEEARVLQNSAQRLLEWSLRAQQRPPEDVKQSVVDWCQQNVDRWASSRRPKNGLPLADVLQKLGDCWAQRWEIRAIQSCLVRQWWRGQLSRSGSSLGENVTIPAGARSRDWWRAAIEECEQGQWLQSIEQCAGQWSEHLEPAQRRTWLEGLCGAAGMVGEVLISLDLHSRRRLALRLLQGEPLPVELRERAAEQWELGQVSGGQSSFSREERLDWLRIWTSGPQSRPEQLPLSISHPHLAIRWCQEAQRVLDRVLYPALGSSHAEQPAGGERRSPSIPSAQQMELLHQLRRELLAGWVQRPGLSQQRENGVELAVLQNERDVWEWNTLWRVCRTLAAQGERLELEPFECQVVAMWSHLYAQRGDWQESVAQFCWLGPGVLSLVFQTELQICEEIFFKTQSSHELVQLLMCVKGVYTALLKEPAPDLGSLLDSIVESTRVLVGHVEPRRRLFLSIWEVLPAWFSLLGHATVQPETVVVLDQLQWVILNTLECVVMRQEPPSVEEQRAAFPAVASVGSLALGMRNTPSWLPFSLRFSQALRNLVISARRSGLAGTLQQLEMLVVCASWANRADRIDFWDEGPIWPLTRSALAQMVHLESNSRQYLFKAIKAAIETPTARQSTRWGSLLHIAICWAACDRDQEEMQSLMDTLGTDELALFAATSPDVSWLTWDAAMVAAAQIEQQTILDLRAGESMMLPSTPKPHRLLAEVLERCARLCMGTQEGRMRWSELVERLATKPALHTQPGIVEQVRSGILLSSLIRIEMRLGQEESAKGRREGQSSKEALKDQDEQAEARQRGLLQQIVQLEDLICEPSPHFLLTIMLDQLRESQQPGGRRGARSTGRLAAGSALVAENGLERGAALCSEYLVQMTNPFRLVASYRCMVLSRRGMENWEPRAVRWLEQWEGNVQRKLTSIHARLYTDLEQARLLSAQVAPEICQGLLSLGRALAECACFDSFLLRMTLQVAGALQQILLCQEMEAADRQVVETIAELVVTECENIPALPSGYDCIELASMLNHEALQQALERWWQARACEERSEEERIRFEQAHNRSLLARAVMQSPLRGSALFTRLRGEQQAVVQTSSLPRGFEAASSTGPSSGAASSPMPQPAPQRVAQVGSQTSSPSAPQVGSPSISPSGSPCSPEWDFSLSKPHDQDPQ